MRMKGEKSVIARVYGIVQGVGFRPTVSRHAARCKVRGSVCNKGPYVEIKAQGSEENVDQFLHEVEWNPPERASILKMDVHPLTDGETFASFEIIESEKIQGDIFVSPDIAICDKCKKELFDKNDKRYLHPFINCTCCGPRLTILDSMPYDRIRTSMGEFPMCPTCEYEYTHAETRRYDAQPVCCNECGPEVYLLTGAPADEAKVTGAVPMGTRAAVLEAAKSDRKAVPESEIRSRRAILDSKIRGREAIMETRKVIKNGGIAAVKGIGGFHLCCDASNQQAVERLRRLKTRPAKPFAVMMRDLETVERECQVGKEQLEVLDGHQKPIILLKRKENGHICSAVAPDNPKIGVMLPYAPVQLLLFQYDDGLTMPDCLVMTSGNVSGAPICRDDSDAMTELSRMCDVILSHNRLIRLRADDSVMDFYAGKPYMIRRSRGYAPLPFMTSNGFSGEVLAVGGELKNTFCIGKNDLFYQSPYIGDMGDLRTVKALKESILRMEGLLEAAPQAIACDLHPRYNTTYAAQELGAERKIPVIPVQHHYAHIVSCMAENDFSEPVIGVSFDGTGYGTDGTIWGGEILKADYRGFERLGHIRPFLQVGGDASAKEGWRIAVSMLYGICKDREKTLELIRRLELCDEKTAQIQLTMADKKINSVVSTSAGRLFDGVSAILQVRKASTFEGEASTTLEFAAEAYEESCLEAGKQPLTEFSNLGCDESDTVPDTILDPLPWTEDAKAAGNARDAEGAKENNTLLLPTDRLVWELTEAFLQGKEPGMLAFWFHERLAELICKACVQAAEKTGIRTAALSGGVYQNQLLLRLSSDKLKKEGFQVLTHSLLPPNDGGIALGQAVVAMQKLNQH
ncbi:MAG: carbamoyltransferase HypF [Lachnospiraceae bacterium]|nr:carbamoyltransferase HypF [Lachnospiraceae bacterium]